MFPDCREKSLRHDYWGHNSLSRALLMSKLFTGGKRAKIHQQAQRTMQCVNVERRESNDGEGDESRMTEGAGHGLV